MTKTIRTQRLTMSDHKRLADSVGTLNASKLGKHRRGTLLLVGVSWDRETVSLEWKETGGVVRFQNSMGEPIQPKSRFCIYRHADHRRMMRRIVGRQNRWSR